MLEPPSPQLVRLLSELQLCTPGDLRRCRGRVRRLAHDLPAFDSVWLDALVQRGRITPFQAGVLESNRPERLRVGPCVLEQRLGGGPEGDTFQARFLNDRTACVVKLVRYHDEFVGEIIERFHQLTSTVASFAHPSIVAPQRCERAGERLAIVSRLIPGPPLSELLIRRGRFPAPVVWDIARQLLDGLQALHARGCVHGDVRVANVRLTAGGVAVLVDAGAAPALSPHLIPDPHRPPDRYDGMPPEIIGTGIPGTPGGDLYSLGCLLWHLLAGRPPFPGGDPLWKLAAHQTRRVPEIRDFAPDTPEMLARSIAAMTARDPQQRPPAEVLLQHWRPARAPARRRLTSFLAAFEHPHAPTRTGPASGVPWVWLAVLLLAISGAAVTLFDNGARNHLLSTLRAAIQPANPEVHSAAFRANDDAPETSTQARPLPAPDVDGAIELDSPGPYEAAEISTVGPLTIRGLAGVRPVIQVASQPLALWGATVRLDNVHVARAPGANSGAVPTALVLVQSQGLEVRDSTFIAEEPQSAREATGARTIGIAWKLLDGQAPAGGSVLLERVGLWGRGAALHVAGRVRKIACRNVLKVGPGVMINLASPTGRELGLQFEGVTCRQSGAVVRWNYSDAQTLAKLRLRIDANHCVFDLAGRETALVEWSGTELPAAWERSIEWDGEGSLAPVNVAIAGRLNPADASWQALDATKLALEGLLASPFEFAGPPSFSPADAVVSTVDGPRLSSRVPGIQADEIAAPPRGE